MNGNLSLKLMARYYFNAKKLILGYANQLECVVMKILYKKMRYIFFGHVREIIKFCCISTHICVSGRCIFHVMIDF